MLPAGAVAGRDLHPLEKRRLSTAHGYYGLGVSSGSLFNWDWFGHSGGLQGYITRTATLPAQDLTISVLTNAIDGWAGAWVDGVVHILRAFAHNGPPIRKVADWTGRWWNVWGAVDLVPMGTRVMVAAPWAWNPMLDAADIQHLLWVCAVERRRFSSGCESHPATAPAGSDRSSYGGNEMAEAFG